MSIFQHITSAHIRIGCCLKVAVQLVAIVRPKRGVGYRPEREDSMYRRVFVQSVAAIGCAASAARTQPGMPLRVVFPFPAGGSGGALARLVADGLAAGLGQPAIVDNKPGAGGRIGAQMVRNAAPDGTTLLLSPIAPMAVYQHAYKSLGYDPLADFRPITQLATFEFGLAVGAGVPARTVAELVAWVKANPQGANYGSPAPGTLPHFLGVWFGHSVGIDWRHIGYGATARPINDLVSGHIPIVFYSTNELVELHKAGRIHVLATSAGERSIFLPDVPTFREAGYDIEATGWFGLFAPAGMQDAIVERLNRTIVTALQSVDTRDRIRALGLNATGTSAETFARIQRADAARWAPAVRASGFTGEESGSQSTVTARPCVSGPLADP